jgi:hypothetical protein
MNEVTNTGIKEIIKDYIYNIEQLDEINKGAKDIRSRKKLLEEQIREYMIENGLAKVSLKNSGSLKITKSITQKKIGKKEMMEFLLTKLTDDQTEDFVNEMFDASDDKEVVKLQHTKSK